MEVINAGMKKSIKTMCVVAQTAQFVALMPKPQDFVVRVIGDVVYLSAQVKKLSDELNKMLDSYSDIPVNYLMTQMNSITGSISNITNKVAGFSSSVVNQTMGMAEGMSEMVTELTGSTLDIANSLTDAVVGLGSAVVETPSNIIGQTEFANEVHEGTEVILEWVDNKFNNVRETSVDPLVKSTETLRESNQIAQDAIGDAANIVNDNIAKAYEYVEKQITNLRNAMKKLESAIDGGFKDSIGLSSVSSGADEVTKALSQIDNPVAQAAGSITSTISEAINNFSISKVITAFTGILVQSLIVRTGLDTLPPIDFEAMMCQIRDDLEMTTEDLYAEYKAINGNLDDAYDDFIKFGDDATKIPTEERIYGSKNYQEFVNKYDGDLKEQRNNIRMWMKYRSDIKVIKEIDEQGNEISYTVDSNGNKVDFGAVDTMVKRELKSAIKEARKYRKKVKGAKQTQKLKEILVSELNNLKKETEYRCNSIKADWYSMMDQYKNAIKEIKEFFTTGGSCDMFIDDCCNAINKDFDDIKELCKSITTQLIGCSLKIAMPSDIGPVGPNPAYKIADFWMDIKTIFKFLKDLITLVIDIMNNINKLARLMINGLNSLTEIIKQLMELLGLKWLMDLIQSVIDAFGDNITNSKLLLENTLSPVYFSDTKEYENCLEVLEELLEGGKLSDEKTGYLADAQNFIGTIFGDGSDLYSSIGKVTGIKSVDINAVEDPNAQTIEEFIDKLEESGEEVVAYKSPIIEETGSTKRVSELTNGEAMDNDIKFIGWHFFHPNLNHTGERYYSNGLFGLLFKKIKSKIMKKAAETGHKKNGGVNKLKINKVGFKSIGKKYQTDAYTAFYWYTYYTEDLEQDCFERNAKQGSIIITSVMQTQNGSIVELTDGRKVFVADNMVRSGDYVVVDGVKYRVK